MLRLLDAAEVIRSGSSSTMRVSMLSAEPPAGSISTRCCSCSVRSCRPARPMDLVADTYRRFPFFATRSEIAERVLKGDCATLAQIEAFRKPPAGPAFHTIG
jgi:hypothetical protein